MDRLNKALQVMCGVASLGLASCTSLEKAKKDTTPFRERVHSATVDAYTKLSAKLTPELVSMDGQSVAVLGIKGSVPMVLERSERIWTTLHTPIYDGPGWKTVTSTEVGLSIVTADVVDEMQRTVEGLLRDSYPKLALLSSLTIQSNLAAIGITDRLELLRPERLKAFCDQIRDRTSEPVDALFIVQFAGDQVELGKTTIAGGVSLDYIPLRAGADRLVFSADSARFRWEHTGELVRTAGDGLASAPVTASATEPQQPLGPGATDDTPAAARIVPLQGEYRDAVNPQRDVADYYRIDAPGEGYVLVTIQNRNPGDAQHCDVGAQVCDSSEKVLSQTGWVHNNRTQSAQKISIAPGSTYYLKVLAAGQGDFNINYTLSLSYTRN